MSEWVYRDCPTCVHVDELEPEDSTNPVDWYGTLHEPIVRCRDCKYYASNMHECMRLDVWDDSLWFSVEQDDFCSFAAKEEQ